MRWNLTRLASRGALVLSLVLCVATFSGCGQGGNHSLTGRVTTQAGEPVAAANLMFRSDSHTCRANTDEQGDYVASLPGVGAGVPAGDYRVSIMEYTGDPEKPSPRQAHVKYATAKSSGLTVTVPAEDGTFDMVLDAPQKRPKR